MIPLRVYVKGFLSYRGEETFDFRERKLWMLSGRNGAGKSTVFDAVSFSLFHRHRGGSSKAGDLINWHCDEFVVSFEFEVGGEKYRAYRREPRKGTPERLLSRWNGSAWTPLDGSRQEAGFGKHIHAILGMDYETFCVSILLRQGKVDRLLDVDPADRFDILSQIVDLSKYEELRQHADQRRKIRKNQADDANRALAYAPEVSVAEIEAQEQITTNAAECMRETQLEVTRLAAVIVQAGLWVNMNDSKWKIEESLEKADDLVVNEASILRDAARLTELKEALPRLEALYKARSGYGSAFHDVHKAQTERNQAITKSAAHVDWDDARALKDPTGVLAALETRIEELGEKNGALPSLRIFSRKREEARKAIEAREALIAAPVISPTPYETFCVVEITASTVAGETLAGACEKLNTVNTNIEEAEARLERFHEAGDAAECRYCGQIIPKDRRAGIQRELQDAIAELRTSAAVAEGKVTQAKQAVTSASKALASARIRWQAASTAAELYRQQARDAATTYASAQHDAFESYDGLPKILAGRIESVPIAADPKAEAWACVTNAAFPTPLDITTLESEVKALSTCRLNRGELQTKMADVTNHDGVVTERILAVKVAEAFLSPDWRVQASPEQLTPETITILKTEQRNLAGADERREQIEEAKQNRKQLQQQLKDLGTQMERLPVEARRPVGELEGEQQAEQGRYNTAQKEWKEASGKTQDLRQQRTRRLDLEWLRDETRREEGLYETLAKLLSADNLQSYLLQGAEAAIVEYANLALSAFSGSELRLERRAMGEDDDDDGAIASKKPRRKALDLLCHNTETSDAPLPLHCLSGSQKFRVAVSLALGIGQFASRTDARIQSVIIDEGFGSLDLENQSGMAAELQALADRLERIIVVSHQETFADAFPDRIHIALGENGSYAERLLN